MLLMFTNLSSNHDLLSYSNSFQSKKESFKDTGLYDVPDFPPHGMPYTTWLALEMRNLFCADSFTWDSTSH